jgi:deoxyribose-phosphate aldolase
MTTKPVRGAAVRTAAEMAAMIDHTLLEPQATPSDIERLCREAVVHQFATVCVNPVYVAEAWRILEGAPSTVSTVVGFPLGATLSAAKADDARRAIDEGASEIDMVLFIGGLKAGETARVRDDIAGVVAVCEAGHALCKVIIETCLLTNPEKERACRLCIEAGADFVKTSTGFSTRGATVEDVTLMAGIVTSAGLRVKAAGGVRTLEDARRMIAAGASRIGTSSGVEILRSMSGVPAV